MDYRVSHPVLDAYGGPILIVLFAALLLLEHRWSLRRWVRGFLERLLTNAAMAVPTFVVMRLVERLGVILHMKDIRDRPYFADAAKRVGEFVEDRRERKPGMFLRLRARRILRDLKGMLPFRRPAP